MLPTAWYRPRVKWVVGYVCVKESCLWCVITISFSDVPYFISTFKCCLMKILTNLCLIHVFCRVRWSRGRWFPYTMRRLRPLEAPSSSLQSSGLQSGQTLSALFNNKCQWTVATLIVSARKQVTCIADFIMHTVLKCRSCGTSDSSDAVCNIKASPWGLSCFVFLKQGVGQPDNLNF